MTDKTCTRCKGLAFPIVEKDDGTGVCSMCGLEHYFFDGKWLTLPGVLREIGGAIDRISTRVSAAAQGVQTLGRRRVR